jgi:hypothetical protein
MPNFLWVGLGSGTYHFFLHFTRHNLVKSICRTRSSCVPRKRGSKLSDESTSYATINCTHTVFLCPLVHSSHSSGAHSPGRGRMKISMKLKECLAESLSISPPTFSKYRKHLSRQMSTVPSAAPNKRQEGRLCWAWGLRQTRFRRNHLVF